MFEGNARNKMALICLDTQILIWGIRKQAEPGQEQNIARAEHLIDMLTKNRDQVVIPSITYAEACVGVPEDRLQVFMNEMQKRFIIIPFDVLAAHHYRQIFLSNKQKLKQYKSEGYTRPNQFADMKIVATALACKAKSIYSEDPHLEKIANGFIDVINLPSVPPKQLTLAIEPAPVVQ